MKRTAYPIMLTLLLMGMLALEVKVQPIEAEETIYIREDGTVDPPLASIQRNESLYEIVGDINGSIVVERDNITIDGNNNRLMGETRDVVGIDLSNRENVTVTRVHIERFSHGIWLENSDNNRLFNNTLIENDYGIWLSECNYNNVTANIFVNNGLYAPLGTALDLRKSNYNTLVENKIVNNHIGIDISYGIGNLLRENLMVNNEYSFYVGGVYLYHFFNDIDGSNTVNGKPIYYWVNRRNETIPSDAGAAIIVNSTNMKVENLTMTNNVAGIELAFTDNSQVKNVTAIDNQVGVMLYSSHNNTITDVNASSNAWCGILLDRSHLNLVVNNTAVNNTGEWAVGAAGGIYLEDTGGNILMDNLLANNTQGIGLDDSWDIKVTGNDIIGNYHRGIVLGFLHNGIITQNNLVGNNIGIWVFQLVRAENWIYHNNFINNSIQIEMHEGPSPGFFRWNTTYPYGGNYWSDYAGMDLFSGPHQNETLSDGIGDTPYTIDENNQDHYPLMNPWSPTDISITSVVPSAREVYVGQSINITINILNNGVIPETFSITCRYELEEVEHSVGSTLVSNLSAKATTQLSFNLTTNMVGAYSITVETTTLPDETNPADNRVTTSLVVKMLGDVNGDNKIDIKDIATAASAFGSHLNEPGWNGQADINRDNKVDIRDLALIARSFGKTYP